MVISELCFGVTILDKSNVNEAVNGSVIMVESMAESKQEQE